MWPSCGLYTERESDQREGWGSCGCPCSCGEEGEESVRESGDVCVEELEMETVTKTLISTSSCSKTKPGISQEKT